MSDLQRAVSIVVRRCLGVRAGEGVVVVVDAATRAIGDALRAHGTPGTNLAELGVGTNDRPRLTGNVLEDEKILGTVHVAFGASAGTEGTVSVPIRPDTVVLDASLEVDGRQVLEAGRYVLDQQ